MMPYKSKCPECGNVDGLTKEETEKPVYCQRCYLRYEYDDRGDKK